MLQELISTKIPLWGSFSIGLPLLIGIIFLIMIIQGKALLKASKKNEMGWFWTLFIIGNSTVILPMYYLWGRK